MPETKAEQPKDNVRNMQEYRAKYLPRTHEMEMRRIESDGAGHRLAQQSIEHVRQALQSEMKLTK